MKVTMEFLIHLREWKYSPQKNKALSVDIENQSLQDIEGAVEIMRQQALPEIEGDLLKQAQNPYTK